MYKKIVARSFGDPEVMEVATIANLPEPGTGDARIRVTAAGIGYTDTIVRRGRYVGYKGGLPVTPGYDMVGVVDAVGTGVINVAVGDRVADMTITGAYSQYIVRPADCLIPVPGRASDQAAIEVPLMWTTAWQMLTREVSLKPGDCVLVVGASGNMGRALVTLARHLKLTVIGTCSAARLSELLEQGIVAIDYRRPDLVEAIRLASGGQGVAAAFDAIAGESWAASRKALAANGVLVGYGMQAFLDSGQSGFVAIVDFLRFAMWNIAAVITGSKPRTVFYNIQTRRRRHPVEYREDALMLLGLIGSGTLRPTVARKISFDEIVEAHRQIAHGGLSTRLVLNPWGDEVA
jgi:NADPH:quinone reductase-like Zn-dependent oxidoreductase